jgi:urease accessory protein
MRAAAYAIRRAGAWPGGASDAVTLDYEGRFLRRKVLTTDAGAALFVDLPETVSLNDGDALETEAGSFVEVRAALEPLAEVACAPVALARLAWHVGNRHTPAQIEEGRLLIRRDHVLEAMLARLGATVRPVMAPFAPEGGAYGHGRTHAHRSGPATGHPHAAAG